jgi:hypothetical protein
MALAQEGDTHNKNVASSPQFPGERIFCPV